jgi:ABC-2 type transport system permease protein
MIVVLVLSSLSVAREREHGTFDQLLVTPFTPVQILVGKAAPAMTFGLPGCSAAALSEPVLGSSLNLDDPDLA